MIGTDRATDVTLLKIEGDDFPHLEIGNDIAASRDLEPVLKRIASHAKEILRVRDIAILLREPQLDAGQQALLAEEIIRRQLTVRAAEKLVAQHFTQNGAAKPTRGQSSSPAQPALGPAIQHLQNRLQQHLATHVTLQHSEKRGRIEIEYYGQDDLDRILQVLGITPEEQ